VSRFGRSLFLAIFVVVVGGAAWASYVVQRSRSDETTVAAQAAADVYDALVRSENAARDDTTTRDAHTLAAFTTSREQLATAIARAREVVTGATPRRHLVDELALLDQWSAAVDRDLAVPPGDSPGDGVRAAARGQQVAAVERANDRLVAAIDRQHRDVRDDAGLRGIVMVVVLCVIFAVADWSFFVRNERRETHERDRQLAFAEELLSARTEAEARSLLTRHLERVAPGSLAIVTSADHESEAGWPITAGGERIGTVVLRTDRDLRPRRERLVRDTIVRAAPVLATLQTLALAQARAATDPLTGLGNRRLLEDAMARLQARERRTGEPFAVVLVDLDSFKAVNDTFGHSAGDALLVAVAEALTRETRADDIVGRFGGDEFILLLGAVAGGDAVTVVERCRAAIADIRLGDTAVATKASFGLVASTAGADPAAVLRAADQAVYQAKARGGDCVVTASPDAVTVQASALRA
jgi:diguanylate cyclase (GGDEF)-like protein